MRSWVAVLTILLFLCGCRSARHEAATGVMVMPASPPVAALPEPLDGPLGYGEAVRRAWLHSADVQALRAAVSVAARRIGASGAWEDPQLRLSVGSGSDELTRQGLGQDELWPGLVSSTTRSATLADSDTDRYAVGLRAFLPHPWLAAAGRRLECAQWMVAECELDVALQRVRAEVGLLMARVRHLDRDAALAGELAALRKRVLDLTREGLGQGQLTAHDAMDASRRYLAALTVEAGVVRERQQARAELAWLIGAPDSGFGLADEPAPSLASAAMDPAALVDAARERRADLALLRWRTATAREAWRHARAARVPWFDYVQASYGAGKESGTRSDESIETATLTGLVERRTETVREEREGDEWEIDTGITLPLFSWGSRETAALREAYEQARAVELRAEQRVQAEVLRAVEGARQLEEQRRDYEEQSGALIEEMEQRLARIEAGRAMTPIEIAQARAEIIDARRAQAEARVQVRLAVVELLARVGGPDALATPQPGGHESAGSGQ